MRYTILVYDENVSAIASIIIVYYFNKIKYKKIGNDSYD